jgi:uncharacterized protein (TIGR02594 family)
MNILTLQKQLRAQGFDPGPEDGIWGRRTMAAVKAFQAAKGLGIDGIVGPQTIAALGLVATPSAPPWYAEALRKVGLHETSDNVALRRYLKSDGATLGDPSKLPWCGDFVETVIALTRPEEPMIANPYWARNWLKFGVPVAKTSPVLGAICVFERGSGGHVGFVAGHDKSYLHVLGGNQSNRVSIAKLAKSRLLGLRWPLTFPMGDMVLPMTTLAATISTNEA